ncbi:hypothetical protein JW756_03940 [Candidatus Woesearchaeota archaeon]|nr:hypothetical protein [Candidatus Woesearchaeota archaeon]
MAISQSQNLTKANYMPRRGFLRTIALAAALGLATITASPIDKIITSETKKTIIQEELVKPDAFIGEKGLEGILQEQYNKGYDAELRLRAAPNIAQLPYKQIIETLNLSKDNPLVMLYPAAGDEITTVLFGYLMKKNSSEDFPVQIICTEIDPDMIERFERQIKFLAGKDALKYELSKKFFGEKTELNFAIQPKDTARFDITYKLDPKATDFFSDEDAQKANILRELASPFVPAHYGFIAQMLKKGYKKDKPFILLMPDYDGIGQRYNDLLISKDPSLSKDNPSLKQILDNQIVELEATQGPLRIEYYKAPNNDEYLFRTMTDSKSKITPFKDIPGEVSFSRGYNACSCDGCMELWKEFGKEDKRMDYSVMFLIKPGDLDGIPEEKLSATIKRAFRGCYVAVEK